MSTHNKVFGVGLSKTGTTSLYVALEMLGYRAGTFRHMRQLGLKQWMAGDFSHDYFEELDAITDLPVATWFRELDQRYPNSKFILTQRPVDPWLASIKKQFEGNPDPKPGFIRDVRLAQYGVATFNADRFRRLHKEHTREVVNHFANRQKDLLVVNFFEGDGWEQICDFLEKPIPDAELPAVKPGFRPEAHPEMVSGRNGDFAFIIPIVHPDGAKVSSYNEVERVLKTTVASILAIDGPKASIIIVCHTLPRWAQEMPPNVVFLNVGNHPLLSAGKNHVQIDKGIKYILGLLWILETGPPRFVMPADGDDYLHGGLMKAVYEREADIKDKDGFIITNGYNALLSWDNDHNLKLEAAFNVRDFDQTCGTCRIFKTAAVLNAVTALDENLAKLASEWAHNSDAREVTVDPASIDTLYAAATPHFDEMHGIVRALGRHNRLSQRRAFDLQPLDVPLAGKGCGHGNHDGSRRGDVHLDRIVGMVPNVSFVEQFGLSESIRFQARRPYKLTLNGYACAAMTRVRQKLAPVRQKKASK